jgi:hypothetical protein
MEIKKRHQLLNPYGKNSTINNYNKEKEKNEERRKFTSSSGMEGLFSY